MTAVTAPVNTSRYGAGAIPNQLFAPQKSAIKLLNGVITVLDGGYACEGRSALGLIVIGVANGTFDNTTGNNGDVTVVVDQGAHCVQNSTGLDQLTAADVGHICYLVDNITVAKTNGGNTRSPAGRLIGFDDVGLPMVLFGLARATSPGADVGTSPAYTVNDLVMTSVIDGSTYDIPATTGVSTVTLPAAAPTGTKVYFTADGTKNANTVQYRDATGPTNLTAALTASKRHLVVAVKGPGGWSAVAGISP